MQKSKTKNEEIIILNVMLTFLIVVFHSVSLVYASPDAPFYNIANMIENFITLIGHIAVPTFFCISTYLFFRNYNNGKYFNKIKSRFISLIIPYFIWNIVFLIYAIVLTKSGYLDTFDNSFPKVEMSFSYIIKSLITCQYNGVMWYICDLFILFLIAPFAYKCKGKNIFLPLISLLILVFNIIFKISYYSVLYWMPLYLLTGYITINKNNFIEWFKKRKISVLNIIVVIFLIVLNMGFYDNYYLLYLFRLMSPLFVFNVIFNIKLKKINVFNKLNKYTFLIFCIHGNLLQIVRKMLVIILGNNVFVLIGIRFLTAFITISIIILLFKFLSKICPKLVSILSGGRAID